MERPRSTRLKSIVEKVGKRRKSTGAKNKDFGAEMVEEVQCSGFVSLLTSIQNSTHQTQIVSQGTNY
ncbi:hypothetical protein DEO72_LG5g2800 [Vigna unguiculata]|uniref:Uncharacterized protein n=1 Tax=Vigna unguiculata TaxID=3917 RepID=A0A4D6M0U8_VIGUN|nr:hypothetical protein DEO72_LG5g2800 [Vigna unguiculata]